MPKAERFRFAGRSLTLPLRTQRLWLRPGLPSDVPAFVELLNDPVVHRGTLRIPLPYHAKDAREFLASARRTRRRGTGLPLQMVRRSDGALVGGIGLHAIRGPDEEVEIGYWVGAPYRRQGFASEAVQALTKAAFRRLGLHRITAHIFLFNRASAGVLRRCGFRREGIIREARRKDGRWINEVLFARLSTDPPP